jgi:hypothetical protein
MTKLEIIEETFNYYSEDGSRRAMRKNWTGGDLCEYKSPEGKYCAVGRCMIDPKGEEMEGNIFDLCDHLFVDVNELLKEEYKGHDVQFWLDLQHFHDSNDNWTRGEVNEEGLLYINNLKEKYKND